MRGAASNGSNGDATLAMDGQEAVWTNVSYDRQGERTVAVLRFIPRDEGATCHLEWKDPKTGEEKKLTVMKRYPLATMAARSLAVRRSVLQRPDDDYEHRWR